MAETTMGLRMRIAIASDHAALDLKAELRDWLIEQGHEVADLGPDTADSVDYPDFGYRLASVVADGTAERALTQVKSVDDAYPLTGSVTLEPSMPSRRRPRGMGPTVVRT